MDDCFGQACFGRIDQLSEFLSKLYWMKIYPQKLMASACGWVFKAQSYCSVNENLSRHRNPPPPPAPISLSPPPSILFAVAG